MNRRGILGMIAGLFAAKPILAEPTVPIMVKPEKPTDWKYKIGYKLGNGNWMVTEVFVPNDIAENKWRPAE